MADNITEILLRARMEVSGVEAGVSQIQKSLKGLTLPKGISDELEKSFGKLTPLLKDYQKQLNKGFSNKKDLQNFNALKEKISETFGEIRSQIQTANSQEIRLKVDTQEIDKLENKIVAKTADLQKALNNVFTKSVNSSNIDRQLSDLINNTKTASSIKPMANLAKELFNTQDYAAYNAKIDEMKAKILSLSSTKIKLGEHLGVKDAANNIDAVNEKIKKFFDNLKVNEGKVQTIEHLKQELADLGIHLDNLKLESLGKGAGELENLESILNGLASGLRQTGDAAGDAGTSMIRMVDEVNQLKTSTQYFFSLRNMINLFKRGVDDAIQSVKELDKAMTDTAVVTDYKVSDLWGMLPDYTKIANELGATTQGAYETMTLYFQQGLEAQQAFEIGAETMKMARIAGMQYADATDMMTAALRGFNMELDNVSAQRINDVYSQLAAKTASDTEELGTAMQRTASIAHSAGMSFEGTAAFLAQAIETTREPAENLGTAMKTIVARFQELKKNPLEMVEVDGEEVSYNKVDTALQSIGVSLKDTNGQFRDLDQVFLDISQRWDSLSQVQQRYIATTAAGSRQQSRFIAMMSNYNRTMELMSYANDSAGASNEQFGKTMDSLEAKLNKFHNAWQEFTMNIANNSMIKWAVDAGTTILGTINKIIEALSHGNGVVKSFLSLFTAFTGLKGFGRLANIGLGGLAGAIDPNSSIKEGLRSGLSGFKGNNQAKAITNPIVAAIHGLIPHIDKAATGDIPYKYQQSGNYKGARADLSKTLTADKNSYSIGGMLDIIDANKLNKQQQKDFFQSSPGLKYNLTNSLSNLFTEVGMDPKVSRGLIQGFKSGELALDEVLSAKSLSPKQVAELIGLDDPKSAEMYIANEYDKIFTQVQKEVATSGATGEEAELLTKTLTDQRWNATSEIIPKEFIERLKVTKQELTTSEKVANGVGKFGASLTSLGYSAQMVGAQLSQFNPVLGDTISSMGNLLTTAGSLINIIPQLISLGPVALVAAAGIAAFGISKYQSKKIKKAAEEVVNTYSETTKEITEKVNSLKSAQNVFSELSRGVDKFGNNISLTEEDYSRYLETVDNIASMAPELIRGYDAQGHAILATGSAIDELIAKEEELKKQAVDTFISDTSINSLVAGIQESDAFKKAADFKMGDNYGYLTKEAGKISSALSKAGVQNFDEISKQLFGRKINLLEPSNDDLILLSEHYNDIINLIESENQNLTDTQKQTLENAFTGLSDGWNGMLAELQPLSQAIGQYLSSEGLDTIGLNLGEEFTSSFNQGLKSLTATAAIKGWDSSKIKEEARNYAEGFKAMTQEGSDYANIMKKVTTEQEKYNDSVGDPTAIDNYKDAVEDYAVELEQLADSYDDGTVAGELFANSLREQANSIRNYATESIVDLGQALNTLSDEFASARGAEDRFKKAIESGDYYTAAESYKNIIDTVLDEKNVAGNGSIAGWTGAEEILGTKFIDSHNWDEVVDRIKTIAPMFEDGISGVQKFGDFLVEAAGKSGKELEGLGEVIDGQFHFNFDLEDGELDKFADKLGISTDALAALIDKSRQFVAWNISDMPQVRKALEQNGQSMIGQNGRLYTSESSFRAEAKQQGIFGDDYTKTKKDLQKEQNVEFLTVKSLTAQDGKGLGLDKVLDNIGLKGTDKTLNNTVAALSKMGFELEDQKQILTANGVKLADGAFSVEDIEQAYNEQAYALENPTVAGIANDTGVIASAATAMLASMGILTDEAKAKINQSTSEENIKGLKETLNPQGGFIDSNSRNAARAAAENQLADYKSTMSLLEKGGLTDSAEYAALANAVKELEGALEVEANSWSDATAAAQQYVDGIGQTTQEQQFLNSHAIDIQTALQSSDPTVLVDTLQQLQQEGNLSTQTMLDLGASLSHLEGNEVYLSALNALMSNYYEQVKAARDETYQPFVITSKLKGEDLVNYVSSIDELTFKERQIILDASLYGDEKVFAFLDEINSDLKGDETTKTVLIEATARIANGDTAGANELLQKTFGDQAQEVQSKLDIICDGSIANEGEVRQAIESQISKLSAETQVDVKANVKAIYTNTTPKAQDTTVNYKKGTQAKATPSDTIVNYTKIGKQVEPKPKDADLSYKLKSQENPKDKTAYVTYKKKGKTPEEDAKGRNNTLPAHQSLSFGSAAGGMNVPKSKFSSKQKITALVGEEGFEVGYIPSEARSVIFGASGPEMTSFPSDTIIYPHEQSKKILQRGKKEHKSLGSFGGGNTGSSKGIPTSISNTNNNSDTKKNNNDTKKNNKDTKKNNDKAKEVIDKAGRLSVWWENMARKVDATQRKVDKTASKFEKIIQGGGKSSTRANADAIGKDYAANLNKIIDLSTQQINKATEELKALDYDKGSKTQKGKKKLYNNGAENIAQISYTNKKGKSKQKFVNIGQYIKEQDGTYVVDEAKIKKNVKDPGERQAIADAANKELNDRLQKLYNAEDALAKAQEALEKMADDTYEAFDQWDKTITQVYLLGQRLEQLAKQQSVYEAAFDSEISRLTAGFGNAFDSVERINSALTQSQNLILSQVDGQSKLIGDAFKEYQNLLDLDTYYNKTIGSNANSPKAKEDYEMMKETLSFLKEIGITDMNNFDYTNIVQQLENQKYTQNAYEKIKNGLDKIHDTQEAYYSSIEDSYKLVNDLYGLMNEYESFISEFEQNLLESIEDQTKNEIDKLDKLNSSLSKAYKDLLDEVKKRLDERRKREDNQKTESDISKKQQRLAMLQADTSGGHQVEIAQLQKEIAEAQQNYQRSLEDQLLEKLQNQADEAEKQRERQIELLEKQAEIASQLGTNLEEVKKWLQDPEANFESIRQAYYSKHNYDTATPEEQANIKNQFEADFAKYLGYSEQIKYLKSLDDHLLEILHKADDQAGITHLLQDRAQIQSKLNAARQKAEQELQNSGEVSSETQKEVDNLEQRLASVEAAIEEKTKLPIDDSNSSNAASGIKEPTIKTDSPTETADKEQQAKDDLARRLAAEAERTARLMQNKSTYDAKLMQYSSNGKLSADEVKNLIGYGAAEGVGKNETAVLQDLANTSTLKWNKVLAAYIKYKGKKAAADVIIPYFNSNLTSARKSGWKSAFGKDFPKYATGGIANYTGPAWLDGTPSKPELVLNAKDTQNFLALRDVLSKAIGSSSSITNSYGGDSIFEININVDKIEKDYDVDRVIEKVKKEITKGAGYRNVTQVRNFR